MERLRGIITAMVTPFDAEGGLNLAALPGYLAFQREAGVDGVVVCGTNGEGPSLAVDERKRLLDAVLVQRGELAVIAGTGAASITDAVELTRHAASAGADAVLCLPPFFFKNPSARGVAAYFLRVLDAASIPVLLYSIPQQSAVPIADEVIALLYDHPNLAGIKLSQVDWDRTAEVLERWPRLRGFSGADEVLSRSLASTAAGAVSGTANSFPDLVVGVRSATRTGGDVAGAQAKLDAAKTIVLQYPLIAGNKSVLARRGVDRMWVRPPLIDLTAAQEAELISRLEDEGLLRAI